MMAAPFAGKVEAVGAPPPKPPVPAGPSSGNGEARSKKWQMEMLMEKLRSKTSQYKTFTDSAKSLKLCLLDKRYPMDLMERQQLQKCLDTLQHSFKVTSLQSMVERLGSVTRQLGLKFMAGLSGTDWFISSDMFYLEVVLEQSGSVKDVKIHHEGKVEQQSCEELVNCLVRGDFADFAKQLESLAAIYQINADKKQKGKVFQALQSLETDLMSLAEIQSFIKEPHNLVHKSPVGILEKRKGGHPMRLTYFVSPYDLLDEKSKSSIHMTVENVTSKKLGQSVEVCNEASALCTHHKLPVSPLITIATSANGKRSPAYANLGPQNSASLPATFVLRLCKPMPLCSSLLKSLQQITEVECGDLTTKQPMLSQITKNCSSGSLDSANNKGLHVTLPDQQHCYFLTESRGLDAIMVQNIPFTHPTHVPQILSLLRQQALFNTLVESCVRPASKSDFIDLIIFEVSALSNQQLSISFEHPMEEAMATVEMDLSDICNVRCRLYGPISDDHNIADFASKVMQRSLSIPITMRALIQKWQQQAAESSNSNFGLRLGNFNTDTMQSKLMPDFECKPVSRSSDSSSVGASHNHMMGHLGYQAGLSTSPEPFFPSQITVEPIVGPPKTSPLLLNMMGEQKAKKRRRSKVGDAGWTGRSPKRKLSTEEDASEDTQGSYDSMGVTNSEAMDFLDDALGGDSNATEAFVFEDESQASADSSDELRRKMKRARLEGRKNSASSTDSKNSSDNHQAFDISMEGKTSLVGPSVSITPISTPTEPPISSVLGNLDKRSGIEIIPLGSGTPSLPSSITITPIKSEERTKERSRDEKSKSRDKRPDDKKSEKKKKRHRDEDGGLETGKLMGPPQVPGKEKPRSESKSPKPLASPSNSPPLQRKYQTSPTPHLSPGSGSSSAKPQISMVKTPTSPTQKVKSRSSSPKHSGSSSSSSSPIYGSPKHSAVSPKHSSPSPKSSSGKPSMSTLKGSLTKSSSSSSSSSDPNRVKKDKDKKSSSSSSSSSSSPKTKSSSSSSSLSSSSSSKGKQDFGLSGGDAPLPAGQPPMTPAQKVVASLLDLDPAAVVTSVHSKQGTLASDYSAGSPPPQSGPGAASLSAASAQDPQSSSKCPLLARSRKGSLSAVIDKLKSAQTSPPPDLERVHSDKPKSSSSSQKSSSESKNGIKNSEYMVKSSSEGIKITINKTKKDSKSSSSSSKSSSLPSSPKHTGLKPGVISGPASKKPLHKSNSSSSSSSSNRTSSPSSKSKGSLSPSTSKSSSSSSSKSSSSSSPKSNSSSSDKRSKDKSRDRHSSPSTFRDDSESERAFKILAAQAKLDIEMPKLDTKFHIPKLSRSESKEDKKEKVLEPKVELKKLDDKPPVVPNNLKMVPVVALPMLPCHENPPKILPDRDTPKSVECEMPDLSEPSPPPPKLPIEVPKDCDSDDSSPGLLIDFSVDKKGVVKGSPPPPPLPPMVAKSPLPVHLPPVLSPSVSVHIVKSPAPAPSPLILPSPHSSQPSPCITDDELMDEALVGLGK